MDTCPRLNRPSTPCPLNEPVLAEDAIKQCQECKARVMEILEARIKEDY